MDDIFIPSSEAICVELFRRGDFSFITDNDVTGQCHLKQLQALQVLTDKCTNEFLYGGAAGGAKSWTGCAWLAFMSKAYPGTRWFIGREELKRLRDSTLQTFFKVCKAYHITGWEYKSQDHYILFDNGSRIDLLDLKYLPADELYERYGSIEYTGGWIEEGGEVNFGAYDTLKSRVGRHLNDKYGIPRKLFVTCNPKKNWLYRYFFEPFTKGQLPDNRKFLQALVQDNPFRESGYVEGLESLTDKSKKERLLRGNWNYEDDPSVLMDYPHVTACFINDHVLTGKRYLTIDVARYGEDKTVIIVWSGLRAEKIIKLSKKGIGDINTEVLKLQKEYQISKINTIADDDGIGGGLVDINKCLGFVNNASPVMQGKQENYSNLRSQCYFKLAEVVNEGELYIKSDSSEEEDLIAQELGAIKKKNPDSDEKKISIISREEIKQLIGRSPDYASALMMRMRFLLTKSPGGPRIHIPQQN